MAGMELDSLETIAERRMKDKIKAILENPSHPLYKEQRQIGITFSLHILPPRCQTERFRHSFVVTAIRLYNSSGSCSLSSH